MNQIPVRQQRHQTFKQKVVSLLQLPSKLILASTLILMSVFQSKNQQRELCRILKEIRNDYQIRGQAKQQLLKYLDLFNSSRSFQCPIMIREYKPKQQLEAYEIGLIINGQYMWGQAIKKIREHLKIDANTSVSFFCGSVVLDNGPVVDFYHQHKHQDGILYIQYLRLQSYG